jgi:apolipoprotein D and lipocalin family protein
VGVDNLKGVSALYRVIVAVLLSLTLGCTSMKQPLQPVPHVDLPRYMGDWYVIANIPYFAEKNCFDSIESYALRSDGKIDNWFRCRKGSFAAPMERKATAVASVDDKSSNAVWTVKFFHIIPVKYMILALDPNYQWVVVGHPSRSYGWVMARRQTLDDDIYQRLLADLARQGYDPAKFQKVPQQQSSDAPLPASATPSH